MWDKQHYINPSNNQSLSDDDSQTSYDSQSTDSRSTDSQYSEQSRGKRPIACALLGIVFVFGGLGYYLSVHVFDVFGETGLVSEPIDYPSNKTTLPSFKSHSDHYKDNSPNKICISIESESPPPSPCIECIVSDALNKKKRRLSLNKIFRDPEQTTNTTTNNATNITANIKNTSSFLEILQIYGNSELQNITSTSAYIHEPATYATVCPEEELLMSLDDCVMISETCPSRKNLPVIVNPVRYCTEIARLKVEMLTEGWSVTDGTSDTTIQLYENLVLQFLQVELDAQCQLSLPDDELCTDQGVFKNSPQSFTDVSIIQGDDCSLK